MTKKQKLNHEFKNWFEERTTIAKKQRRLASLEKILTNLDAQNTFLTRLTADDTETITITKKKIEELKRRKQDENTDVEIPRLTEEIEEKKRLLQDPYNEQLVAKTLREAIFYLFDFFFQNVSE